MFLRVKAATALARLSHCNSVRTSVHLSIYLSHGWISRCDQQTDEQTELRWLRFQLSRIIMLYITHQEGKYQQHCV